MNPSLFIFPLGFGLGMGFVGVIFLAGGIITRHIPLALYGATTILAGIIAIRWAFKIVSARTDES
jgi:hypothetical protein